MSKVVFKQWIYKPNVKGTPKAVAGILQYIATRDGVELGVLTLDQELSSIYNKDKYEKELYVQYIATRPGVVEGENMQHGLFGKLQNMKQIGDINDLDKTRKYIENLAHDKKTIYNAVISLSEDDAIKKELTNRNSWANLINTHINDIAREMDIPPRCLEWCAAVHMEKGHPHLHLMYWNTEQSIGINFIQAKKSNNIRKKLINDLFHDELVDVRKEKDLIQKNIMDKINADENSILKSTTDAYTKIPNNILYELSQKISLPNQTYKILDRHVANRNVSSLLDELIQLNSQIKKEYPQGALKYQYLPKNLKNRLDQISKSIIINNPDIYKEFKKYINLVESQAKIYGGNKNILSYTNKEKNKVYKEIGNKILSCIKDIRGIDYNAKNEECQNVVKKYQQMQVLNLMQSVLDIISNFNYQNSSLSKGFNHDLSKAEKSELKKKQKDKSIEWGD